MGEESKEHIEEPEDDTDKFVGIHAPHRTVLVAMLQDGDRDMSVSVLTIGMPCGKEYVFENRSDVPEKTLMCGCGDLKHVVIKYAVEDSNGTGEKKG